MLGHSARMTFRQSRTPPEDEEALTTNVPPGSREVSPMTPRDIEALGVFFSPSTSTWLSTVSSRVEMTLIVSSGVRFRGPSPVPRSEEHTYEIQSRIDI